MPVMDGIEATSKAMAKFPSLNVLALSMYGDDSYYYKMVKAGVKGFLLKTCDINELETAIKSVAAGESYFSNALLQKIVNDFGKSSATPEALALTDREVDVMKLICDGLTNDEIAEKLHISAKTVKTHRAKLLAKTDSKNTPSMVMYAIKYKIIKV
jgi:DNA-binding NarL/FixJ family response regulator